MLADLALVEHDVLLGINAGSEKSGGHLARVAGQLMRLLPNGDGMKIDHAIKAVVACLHLDESLYGSEIVAQVEIAGWLHA